MLVLNSKMIIKEEKIELFQSLFWWMLVLNSINHACSGERKGFQSLFWWMLVLNRLWNQCELFSLWQVSILVLVDVGLKPDAIRYAIQTYGAFQSLFWWMLVLNQFNESSKFEATTMFQSLFWWMLVLNVGQWLIRGKDDIVSILVLVDVGLKPGRTIPPEQHAFGFNPCFGGCWS